MRIRCSSWEQAQTVVHVVLTFLLRSRFNVNGQGNFGGDGGLNIKQIGRRVYVDIQGVRLNIAKGYCGNHAGPCRFVAGRKHRKMTFLEGLDWVSFNDMLNDALDTINHDGDVASSVCIIRKGKCRRIDYYGEDGGEFNKDTDMLGYADYCGREAPQSAYHQGTPGIIGWKMGCVEAPFEEEEVSV